MNDSPQSGFRIGAWKVFPAENLLKGSERQCILEPKVMDVLVHLAERQGEVVSRRKLLDAVWPDVVVGEEVVSRAISVLRSKLGDEQKDAHYLKTVSKRGYCLVADVTPLTPSEPQGSSRRSPVRKRNIAVAALILLAVSYFAYIIIAPQPGIDETREDVARSIAVLPFVNMSDDARNEYFSDGITEELLNQLSRIPGLRVISRTSSFALREENLDIPAVAERLNVAFVLEGSVRKADGVVRITAQLIDARTDSHLWSDVYERELENVFEVQAEISVAIVDALQLPMGLTAEAVPRKISAASIEAHEAYLRGRYLMRQDLYATNVAAIQEFEIALSHDPNFALAHAEMAMAYPYRTKTNLAKAQFHAERAMALDPNLAESHVAAAVVQWRQEKWEQSLASLQRAVQISPNYVLAYVHMGNLLSWKLGRYDEAFRMRESAMQLDPLSVPTIVYYLQGLIARNRLAEADRILEKIAPIFPHAHAYRRGTLLSIGGNTSHAVLGSLEALRINPTYVNVNAGLAFHLALLGLEEEALAVLQDPPPLLASYFGKPDLAVDIAEDRLAKNPSSLSARHDFGLALAGAGDYDRARPYLEEMWLESGGKISMRSEVFNTFSAVALIAARRHAGDESGVSELFEAILDNVRRYREAGIVGDGRSYGPDYEEGLALFLSGDRDNGLRRLDKGMQGGVFMLPNEAYLQAIYDDPGFAPLRARQEARRDRERQKVLEVVCTNNPYAAVWQPADGTCERFIVSDTD